MDIPVLGLPPIALVGAVFLLGLAILGLSAALFVRDRNRARILARLRAAEPARPQLVLDAPAPASGMLDRVFVPTAQAELSRLRRNLAHAGFHAPRAALVFNLVRFGAGLVLPLCLALLLLGPGRLPLPAGLVTLIPVLRPEQVVLLCALVMVLGFYGPALWLSSRAAERRTRIERAFPNALDLLQVAVEAGLGFDAALSRVAQELDHVAPDISAEFRIAQQEILAGRDREHAFRAMADRLAIDEAQGFVNVIGQSMRFGTSMSSALLTYSADMRQRRELRAQEKANRLPVLMSAVMATLMMPALLIVTIGPVVLRYIAQN